jgi:hypothetical protein
VINIIRIKNEPWQNMYHDDILLIWWEIACPFSVRCSCRIILGVLLKGQYHEILHFFNWIALYICTFIEAAAGFFNSIFFLVHLKSNQTLALHFYVIFTNFLILPKPAGILKSCRLKRISKGANGVTKWFRKSQ